MTKAELEQRVGILTCRVHLLENFIFEIKGFIDTHLLPFRNGIADYENDRNKGVLAVLNALTGFYNAYSKQVGGLEKIEPLEPYKCEVIDFKVLKGENK